MQEYYKHVLDSNQA